MNTKIYNHWKNNRSLVFFIVLMCIFRSAFADWNTVPSGSMKPTILEGDRILVNKMAYDLRIPFTPISLIKIADPQRGDMAVFDSKVADKRLVKRVIGIPGDVVRMQENILFINGTALTYTPASNSLSSKNKTDSENQYEDLMGVRHQVRINTFSPPTSSFSSVAIPQGFYLMLGDNRDMSADSRFIGLVPRSEIIGRTQTVVLSFNYENFHIPRSDRFFHAL